MIENIKRYFTYNSRNNIANRTCIGHKKVNGIDHYCACIVERTLTGKIEYEHRTMSFDEDRGIWVITVGGGLLWTQDRKAVERALKEHIDLNLGRGYYAKEVPIKNPVDYIKYP